MFVNVEYGRHQDSDRRDAETTVSSEDIPKHEGVGSCKSPRVTSGTLSDPPSQSRERLLVLFSFPWSHLSFYMLLCVGCTRVYDIIVLAVSDTLHYRR